MSSLRIKEIADLWQIIVKAFKELMAYLEKGMLFNQIQRVRFKIDNFIVKIAEQVVNVIKDSVPSQILEEIIQNHQKNI